MDLQSDVNLSEDVIFAYARRNNFDSFLEKWNKKPYSDDDYSLERMVADLLHEVNEYRLETYSEAYKQGRFDERMGILNKITR